MADAQQQILEEEFTLTSSGSGTSDSVHGTQQAALPLTVALGVFIHAGGTLFAHTLLGTDQVYPGPGPAIPPGQLGLPLGPTTGMPMPAIPMHVPNYQQVPAGVRIKTEN